MLVLTRYEKQAVLIPDYGITVVVCRIEGNRVRIGIEAPDGVAIMREELLDRYDAHGGGDVSAT